MKKVYLSVLVALLSQLSLAQSLLSGRVVDELGQPLAFANVLLLQQADSSVVAGAVANEKGEFYLALPKLDTGAESALLEVRQIGFSTKILSLNSLKYNEFNIIQLNENINQLDEVVVRAEQPLFQQQLDKLVINVANSGLASGGTVLDVLERYPGISVDRQSGSLSVNGKQGVMVMINGKQQRMPLSMVVQQLEGLSAGQVQKVEIISNPSSRYDAEGDAGIINIVTKKPSDSGTNGTVTAGLGYSDLSGYFKPFGSIMLNHQHKRMTLYTNYSYNRDNRWQQWNYERRVTGSGLHSSTVTDRYASWPIHRGSLGADWQATERTSVNMLASGFSDFWEMESFNQSQITVRGVDSAVVSLYDEEVNHWRHGMVNLNINHQPGDGEKLTVDMDYLYYHDHNPNYFTNTYQLFETDTTLVEYVRTGKETPIRMGVFKLDYEKKWAQVKLEAGAKATISRLENQVKLENSVGETWEPDMRFTHDYALRDDVHAFYLNASGNLNPKNQWQLGLRAESTDMKMNDGDETLYRLDFWKLFPTVFYSWHPDSKTSLQLSYGRRITRPAYTSIAPFVIFMDPFTYYWGNLRLKPAISDGVQATVSYNDLLITLRYNQDRSAIAGQQSRYNAEEGKTYIYADNVDLLSTYSASAGWPHQLTRWWNVQASSLLLYQAISHELNEVSIEIYQFSSRWSLNQKFTLPGNLTFEVSGVYATPTRMGLTLRKSWGSVSAGLQKDIGQHGKLNFTVTDIFWTRNSVYLTDHPLLGQVQQTSYINEPRVIRLSYTLNFGRERDKTKTLRTTASQAEQQRIN